LRWQRQLVVEIEAETCKVSYGFRMRKSPRGFHGALSREKY
jgi:hypothetical protein